MPDYIANAVNAKSHLVTIEENLPANSGCALVTNGVVADGQVKLGYTTRPPVLQPANGGTTGQFLAHDGTYRNPTKADVSLGSVDNTSDVNKPISTAVQTALAAKQNTLVSGTTLKTVGSVSLLGNGDVSIKTVNGISLVGTGDIAITPSGGVGANLTTTRTANDVTVVSDTGSDATILAATNTDAGVMTAAQATKLSGIATAATANQTDTFLRDRTNHTGTQAISTVTGLQTALDGKESAGVMTSHLGASNPHTQYALGSALTSGLAAKQDTLVSATNIKTINGASLLGSGDLTVSGGGASAGTTNLTLTKTSTQVVVVSDTGTDATITAATTTDAGVMTAAQVTKLDSIAASATANQADAFLLSRANHTGTQPISSIVNLQSTLDGKEAAGLVASHVAAADPHPQYVDTTELSAAIASGVAGKQNTLVSGTSLKSINGESLLGSGNIVISGGSSAPTNLSTTVTVDSVTVVSDTGNDATIVAATTTQAGVATAAQIVKLNGIASGATQNSSDSFLRNRVNHTGEQAISTVTGLQTALDGKEAFGAVTAHVAAAHPHSQYMLGNSTLPITRLRGHDPSIPGATAPAVGTTIQWDGTSYVPATASTLPSNGGTAPVGTKPLVWDGSAWVVAQSGTRLTFGSLLVAGVLIESTKGVSLSANQVVCWPGTVTADYTAISNPSRGVAELVNGGSGADHTAYRASQVQLISLLSGEVRPVPSNAPHPRLFVREVSGKKQFCIQYPSSTQVYVVHQEP